MKKFKIIVIGIIGLEVIKTIECEAMVDAFKFIEQNYDLLYAKSVKVELLE